MSLRNDFRQWQEIHPNPFTKKLVDTRQTGNTIIELAKDPRKEFYGVAVWTKKNNDCQVCNDDREKHARFEALSHDLAKSFHDEEEALTYFNTVADKLQAKQEIDQILKEVDA